LVRFDLENAYNREDCRGFSLWPHEVVSQELRGAVAVAVQKGNAMTMIAGRNLAIGRAAACPAA
jgi:hypothetical protein